jgi:hypothetical protein
VRLPARSIRRDLVTWLAAGLLAAIAIAAIATYLRAREEANVLFDYQLQQMAASITGMPLAGPRSAGRREPTRSSSRSGTAMVFRSFSPSRRRRCHAMRSSATTR